MPHIKARHNRAFSLLELSVVLVIIGLVSAMAVSSGISVVATARLSATQQKMTSIEKALLAYRTTYNRLPCPADITIGEGATNYGVQAATPGTCTGGTPAANRSAAGATNTGKTGVEGAVPVATLGLPNDMMYDGWGKRFRYAVDKALTATDAFTSVVAGCDSNAITVKDANGTARTTGAIYALISTGENGHGGYSKTGTIASTGSINTDELINCHCNSSAAATAYTPTYVQKDPTLNSATATDSFDDIVTYKERWQLITAWEAPAECSSTYLYVMDYGNNRVQKFDMDGNFISKFGTAGSGNGQFNEASYITTDSDGNIWVSDRANLRVQKFDADGNYISQINVGRSTAGVAVDGLGNIWVVGYWDSLYKYNSSGALVGTYSGSGSGDGQFDGGKAIVVDGSNNLWVGNISDTRVQTFDNNGNFVSKFSSNELAQLLAFNADYSILWVGGVSNGTLSRYNAAGVLQNVVANYQMACPPIAGFIRHPGTAVVDSLGNAYVTDKACNVVVKYDSSGNLVRQFGTSGSGDGQFNSPIGITIGSR